MTAIWVTLVYENIPSHGISEPYNYYWPLNFERIDRRLLDSTRLPGSVDVGTFRRFIDLCEARDKSGVSGINTAFYCFI